MCGGRDWIIKSENSIELDYKWLVGDITFCLFGVVCSFFV